METHTTATVDPLLDPSVSEASASVVGLCAYSGGVQTFRCSGFVIESTIRNDKFVSSILTSATIFRPKPLTNDIMHGIEINVILREGMVYTGTISAVNFHYNIGIVDIVTEFSIEVAKLRLIDDSFSLHKDFLNAPHEYDQVSGKYKLLPGNKVVALYYHKGRGVKSVVGVFSVAKIFLDCQELFGGNLEIPLRGIGGPMINSYGEVIGINFYEDSCTPFLPINIASVWLEQLKKKSTSLVPHLGMKLENLYMAGTFYLENVMQLFPNITKGVVIDEFTAESPAFVEILPDDIIVKLDEKPVGSILELFEIIWDKVGEPVVLTVLRKDGSSRCPTVIFYNVEEHQLYGWPLYKKGEKRKRWRMVRTRCGMQPI